MVVGSVMREVGSVVEPVVDSVVGSVGRVVCLVVERVGSESIGLAYGISLSGSTVVLFVVALVLSAVVDSGFRVEVEVVPSVRVVSSSGNGSVIPVVEFQKDSILPSFLRSL